MKTIWAPWRIGYLQRKRPRGCVLCQRSRLKADARHYILYRGRETFVILNAFPYTSGHLLVCPYRHGGALETLPEAVLADLMRTTARAVRALKKALRPHGFNIGMNQGRVAGAGLATHAHLHIVPRWEGDTNFMPLFGDVRVLPEYLAATYRRLRPHFTNRTRP